MSVTEQQYRAREKELAAERGTRMSPLQAFNERLLRQAETEAAVLTGHPAWDHYIQRLQADLDDARQGLALWQEKIVAAYTDEDLRKVQLEIRACRDRIETLTHCMMLPKEILEHARVALDKSSE